MPVYFIGHEDLGRCSIKIGFARDIQRRHRELQTGNPVTLKIMGWINSDDDRKLERDIHERFEDLRALGEWFNIDPTDVLSALMKAGLNGFVGKNVDAFQIIGYDKDAIPEYLGVWEWGDLELDQCCPFCGCLGGMHFQDTSYMYYCMSCQMLTNFSELSPNDDEDV